MAQHGNETIKIIRDLPGAPASELDITDLVSYGLVSFSGLGMPPVERLTREMPQQHGVVDVGFRVRPRVITITLLALAQTPQDFHALRNQMIGFMAPDQYNAPVKFRWTYLLASGAQTRELQCQFSAGGSMDSGDMIRSTFVVSWQMIAPDPFWYDPTEYLIEPTYVLPNTDVTYNLQHLSGPAWFFYPRFEITGPWSVVLIHNGSLPGFSIIPPASSYPGELLYTGTAIPAGETVVIDLAPGVKTIKTTTGANRINQWIGDIATFRCHRGDNLVRLYGTGGTTASRLKFYYKLRYIGK